MPRQRKHTLATCTTAALPYSTRTKLKKGLPKVYDAARRNGWLNILYPDSSPTAVPTAWTIERIAEVAKLYPTRYAMQKGPHQWAYKVAMKNGWQHVLPAPLWVKPKTVVAQPVPEGFFI